MNQLRTMAVAASLIGCVWSGSASAQQAAPMTAQSPPTQPQDTMAESTAREADLTDQRARAHYTVGVAMYEAGRFPEAATEFQAAYDLSHRPQLLYNCYVAYRDSSQATRARDALTQYLAEVPDAPNRLHLMARLEALNTEIAAAEAIAADQEAQRLAAEQAARDAALAQQAAEADAHIARQRQRPWWPWLIVGAGAAALGTGIGLGVDASSRAQGVRDQCSFDLDNSPLTPVTRECPTGMDQPVRPLDSVPGIVTQAAIADGLWAGGAILAAAGLVTAFALDDDVPPPVVATGACWTTGCSITVSGEF